MAVKSFVRGAKAAERCFRQPSEQMLEGRTVAFGFISELAALSLMYTKTLAPAPCWKALALNTNRAFKTAKPIPWKIALRICFTLHSFSNGADYIVVAEIERTYSYGSI